MTRRSEVPPRGGPRRRTGGVDPLEDAINEYIARRQNQDMPSVERRADRETSAGADHTWPWRESRMIPRVAGAVAALLALLALAALVALVVG
jgi:hypothetical protein